MTIKSSLTIFCENKGIKGQIKSAFGAYIRSYYATRFSMNEAGETVHFIMNKMSQDDLEMAWLDFVKDLKKYLT